MGCSSSKPATREQQQPSASAPKTVVRNVRANAPLSKSEIQQRIEAPTATAEIEIDGLRIRYAWVSQRGYYPESPDKENQDAYSIIPNFCDNPQNAFFGIYDGHGKEGHSCARFVRDNLPKYAAGRIKKITAKTSNAYKQALTLSHFDTNELLHATRSIDDSLSGTTAISIAFIGKTMYVCNVGDSRAIVASLQNNEDRLIAKALSSDQTPYRKDERDRVKKYGARILSMDQIEGIEPIHENWGDLTLGDDIDEGGDPPRVWSPRGDYPGTAFTRSLGDMYAEELGVVAEPEILEKAISTRDKIVIIASDGVFEFLTNQMVVDMAARCSDPLDACKLIVENAYNMWLQYEVRTDDISIIAIYLGENITTLNPLEDTGSGKILSTSQLHLDVDSKPVRRTLSREKRKTMIHAEALESDDFDEDIDIASLTVPKDETERQSIITALKSNFLFQHLNQNQRQMVIDVMQPIEVQPGEWVIRQGDHGDRFYVIDHGRYEVRVKPPGSDDPNGGNIVHVYEPTRDQHPGFGELSLMYGKPRAASVIALSSGKLWGLDRSVFKKAVMRSLDLRKNIMRTLRKVELLKCLRLQQLQRLADLFNEDSFTTGQYIIRQGEIGENFYIIVKGRCDCTINQQDENGMHGEKVVMHLKDNDYFGEKALLTSNPRAANVIAMTDCKTLFIGKRSFEEVLGPLSAIIDDDRRRREEQAQVYLLQNSISSLKDIKMMGIVQEDMLGPSFLGCFALPQSKEDRSNSAGPETSTDDDDDNIKSSEGVPNVTIRSFIFGEADKISQSMVVFQSIETFKVVTNNTSSPFVPHIQAILRNSNAVHLIIKAPLVCDISTLITHSSVKISKDDARKMSLSPSISLSTSATGSIVENTSMFTNPHALRADIVCYIAACIIRGLQTLHEVGILYRSVQPEGLFVNNHGMVVLGDYRVSKVGTVGGKTYTLCGAADYLAPEQIAQRGHGTPADLWALGVLLYELAVGVHPFSSSSEVATYSKITSFGTKTFPSLQFPDFIPSELKSLINQLLVPTPEARLGANSPGYSSLKKHPFFRSSIPWESLDSMISPLIHSTQAELNDILADGFDDKWWAIFDTPYVSKDGWESRIDTHIL